MIRKLNFKRDGIKVDFHEWARFYLPEEEKGFPRRLHSRRIRGGKMPGRSQNPGLCSLPRHIDGRRVGRDWKGILGSACKALRAVVKCLYFGSGGTEGALGLGRISDQREKRSDFLHLALPACRQVQSLTFLQNRPLISRLLELIQSTLL